MIGIPSGVFSSVPVHVRKKFARRGANDTRFAPREFLAHVDGDA